MDCGWRSQGRVPPCPVSWYTPQCTTHSWGPVLEGRAGKEAGGGRWIVGGRSQGWVPPCCIPVHPHAPRTLGTPAGTPLGTTRAGPLGCPAVYHRCPLLLPPLPGPSSCFCGPSSAACSAVLALTPRHSGGTWGLLWRGRQGTPPVHHRQQPQCQEKPQQGRPQQGQHPQEAPKRTGTGQQVPPPPPWAFSQPAWQKTAAPQQDRAALAPSPAYQPPAVPLPHLCRWDDPRLPVCPRPAAAHQGPLPPGWVSRGCTQGTPPGSPASAAAAGGGPGWLPRLRDPRAPPEHSPFPACVPGTVLTLA